MAAMVLVGCAALGCGAGDTVVGSDGQRVPSVAGTYTGAAVIRPVEGDTRSCAASITVSQSQEVVTLAPIAADAACFGRRQGVGSTAMDEAGQLSPVLGVYTTLYGGPGGFGAWTCDSHWRASGRFSGRQLQLSIVVSPARSVPGDTLCGTGDEHAGYEMELDLRRG